MPVDVIEMEDRPRAWANGVAGRENWHGGDAGDEEWAVEEEEREDALKLKFHPKYVGPLEVRQKQ
jgi:hypothetical protein